MPLPAEPLSFRPSCVVNLTIRFDPKLHVRARNVQAADPLSDADAVQMMGEDQAMLRQPVQTVPLVQGAQDTFITGLIPAKCSVELPGYRQAATFNLTISFRDLPIDPRTVAAAAVEVHLGTVDPRDFSAGMSSRDRDGQRRSVLRCNSADPCDDINSTLVMVGAVDSWHVEHTDSGSEVQMQGRDLRGVLLDSPLVSPMDEQGTASPTRATRPASPTTGASGKRPRRTTIIDCLNLNVPIHNVVDQIIQAHPLLNKRNPATALEVRYDPQDWEGKVEPVVAGSSATTRRARGAHGTRPSPRMRPRGDVTQLNYWDAIIYYCYIVGAIPTIVGRTLWVRPARMLWSQINAGFNPRARTPFNPDARRSLGGETWAARKMIYGQDVKKLTFERKFAGNKKPFVVRCVCADPDDTKRGREKLIEVFYPPQRQNARRPAAPSLPSRPAPRTNEQRSTQLTLTGREHMEVRTFPIRGVRDRRRLAQIAESIWNEVGRNEMGGSASTNNLCSFGGSNADPDLLRLRPGDAFQFQIDVQQLSHSLPIVATLNQFQAMPFQQAVLEVSRIVRNDNLARAIVATTRGAVFEIVQYFRVANVKFEWGKDDGISVNFDFHNFFVPRYDPDPPAQREPTRKNQPRSRQPQSARTARRPTPAATSSQVTQSQAFTPARR